MISRLSGVIGTMVAISLVVAGMWGWSAAARLALGAGRPDLILWAIRSAAIAVLAAAQVLGMAFLVDAVYPRDRVGEWFRLAAATLCTLAVVGALVLAGLGR